MACKIQCSCCEQILKEEGDECKDTVGEYRVYDSLWNSKHDRGKFRVIKCLICNNYMEISKTFMEIYNDSNR